MSDSVKYYLFAPDTRPDISDFFALLEVPCGIIKASDTADKKFSVIELISMDDRVYHALRHWCAENITIYTLSDTCPMCEMVKERLGKLGISYAERPASECPDKPLTHYPIMYVNGRANPYTTKDLMRLVSSLEDTYGKDGIPE